MPVARSTDPWTSWAAARSITPAKLRETQAAVYYVMKQAGPMSLSELVETYEQVWEEQSLPQQSSSGIRTRCKELADDGYVVEVGDQTAPSGRRERILSIK